MNFKTRFMRLNLIVSILIGIFSNQLSQAQKGNIDKASANTSGLPDYKKNKCDSIILELIPKPGTSLKASVVHYTSYPGWAQVDVDHLDLQQSVAFGNYFTFLYPQHGEWMKPDLNLVYKDINGNYLYLTDEVSGSFFILSKSADKLEECKRKLQFYVQKTLDPGDKRNAGRSAEWSLIEPGKISLTFGAIGNKRTYQRWDGGVKIFAEANLAKATRARRAIEFFFNYGNDIPSIDPRAIAEGYARKGLPVPAFGPSRQFQPKSRAYDKGNRYKHLIQELSEEEGKAMIQATGALNYSTPCDPNELPFYYMEVYYSNYTPGLRDFQLKAVLNDRAIVANKIELFSDKFKVARFAVLDFSKPVKEGEKKCKISVIDLQTNSSNDLTGEIIYTNQSNRTKLNQLATLNQVSRSKMQNTGRNNNTSSFKMFFSRNRFTFFNEALGNMIPNINLSNSNSSDENEIIFKAGERVHMRLIVKNNSRLEFLSKLIDFEMPSPISIGIVGDSYSAGEGAPEDKSVPWITEDNGCICHRSNLSGHHLGVCQFVKENPELDIQFKFLSCSGATIQNLIDDPWYSNVLGGLPVFNDYFTDRFHFPQLLTLQMWMNDLNINRLSVLLMSIGGNNSGFGEAVARAFWPSDISGIWYVPPASISWDPGILQFFRNQIVLTRSVSSEEFIAESDATLEASKTLYRNLDAAIRNTVTANKVILSAYLNPMRGPDLSLCKGECVAGGLVWEPKEIEALNDFYEKMISTQRSMSNELHWIYDEEAKHLSFGHGFCDCESTFFNGPFNIENKKRCETPCSTYFGAECMAHPNREGYKRTYTVSTYNRLRELFLD